MTDSKTKLMIEANFLLNTLTCKLLRLNIYNTGLQKYKEMVRDNLLKDGYNSEDIRAVMKAIDVLSQAGE